MTQKASDSTLTFLDKKHIQLEDLQNAYQHIAATKDGELVFAHLYFISGITHFKNVSTNEDRLRQEGQRQLCFGIMDQIALDETALQRIIIDRIRAKKEMTEIARKPQQ